MTTETNIRTVGPSVSIVAHQLGYLPRVRRFTHEDGTPCVAVTLSGLHGAGKEMTLDEADWKHISEDISPWWQVHRVSGVEYVACSSRKAKEVARGLGKGSMLFLARYLVSPGPKLNVRFANNDRLDIRRANLVVVDRAAHSRANVALRLERLAQQDDERRAAMAAANAAAGVR